MAPQEFHIGLDDDLPLDDGPSTRNPATKGAVTKKARTTRVQARSERAPADVVDPSMTEVPVASHETATATKRRPASTKVIKPSSSRVSTSKHGPQSSSKEKGAIAGTKLKFSMSKAKQERDSPEPSKLKKEESVKEEKSETVQPCNETRKRKASTFEDDAAKMVVVESYDQGMTQSATSCNATTARAEEVTAEMSWPGTEEHHSKVPSVIAYRSENSQVPDFDSTAESLFGFEATSSMRRHAFAKAAMDSDAPPSRFNDDVLKGIAGQMLMTQPDGVTAKQVFIDIYRHMFNIQTERFTEQNGPNALTETKRKFVLTFPVACTPKGRQKMLEAAKDAGIASRKGDEICMISEAEAAAIATFFSKQKRLGSGAWKQVFKDKTLVLVVDIGGLTVDVATFAIVAIFPRLKLEERCIPEGGRCGITSMHCRLLERLIALFDKRFGDLPRETIGFGSPLLKQFEKALRKFKSTDSREIRLPLVLEDGFKHPSYDDEDGEIILTAQDMREIMDVTVRMIINIIQSQISQAEKVPDGSMELVVFCGGGSLMPYVFEMVSQFCTSHPQGRLHVVRPDDPQSVVSRGAVMAHLGHRIVGLRKATACFGVKVHKAFDGGVWEECFILQCPIRGKRIDGFLSWHIYKGQTINPGAPKSSMPLLHGYSTLKEKDLDDKTCEYSYKIYTYEGEEPWPTRVTDPGVRELGSFLLKPSEMSDYTKNQIRELLSESDNAEVSIRVQQLCDNVKGTLEFQVKVSNARGSIGTFELNYDEATQENA